MALSVTSSGFLKLAFLRIFLVSIFLSNVCAQSPYNQRPFNNTVSAIFVFGDSTVDSGNNDYITTTVKSDFLPYGIDFITHMPTGRFTNGRLVTDFVASYVGIKDSVPPYLDTTLPIPELLTGVSFASAGSGFDPLTAAISNVIPLQKQVEYFRDYKNKIGLLIGPQGVQNLISKAVFIVSAGTNDYIMNYYGAGSLIRLKSYPNVTSYHQFLMQNIQQFLQGLLDEGVQKIAMVGIPPMGCLPAVITTAKLRNAISSRQCVESKSSVAVDYNNLLQEKLKDIQQNHSKVYYADIYTPLSEMIASPSKYGFDDINIGCCGTGYLEASIFCNQILPVCSDASKYIFWDAIHPTQSAYYNIHMAIRPVVDNIIQD